MRNAATPRAIQSLVLSALIAAAAGCGQPPPPQKTEAAPVVNPLDALASGLASGQFTVVDLTQLLSPATPIIQLPPPFANTPGLKFHEISRFDGKGPAWYWNWIEIGEHVGTHFDAPCHWISGKDKPCVDQLPASNFVGPAVVVDVTAQVAGNPDFVATRATLEEWEQKNGRIPAGAWVILRTGWGSRASDPKTFMNVGTDGRPHYPGFGKESAEFLSKERDVLGVGVEQVGTDAAVGAGAEPPFPNHSIMHGAGKLGLTQLANVDKLPTKGAILVAAPLKLERGSGSPVRVIAIVPAGVAATD